MGVLKYLHPKKVIYAVNSKSQTLRSGGFPFSVDLEENLQATRALGAIPRVSR